MDDKEDFYSACFHVAGMFLYEKVQQGCTKSIAYFERQELVEGYQGWRVPDGSVVKVTVEFVPEGEIEPQGKDS